MQPKPHKTRCQDCRNAAPAWKKGGRWDLLPDAFPVKLRCLFQRHVHAPLCPYVWGGGSLTTAPIHTCQASIWTLMSPHMSGESVAANRIQTQQRLPAANLPLSASPCRLGGGGWEVAEQSVPYIALHAQCRDSQQPKMEN